METKEQLLQYFSGLDTATLQKLAKYSKLLIIPDEDLVTNVTMTQMVEKAHSLADVLFPEWTDRSKSDFGEFLVELFALFSEKDFWYINAFANEGILRKMRSYSNAFSKASSLGYYPVLCNGATGVFSVTFAAGETVTYKRGDLIVAVNGVEFTNDEVFSVDKSTSETTKQLTLKEGELVAEDISYNGYNVFLRKPNIDVHSVKVSIDNVGYTQVKNFGMSGPSSTHFMVLPEEDGSCIIYFGSDGFGAQPSLGKTIHVEYIVCNGSDGNVEADACKISDSLDSREATSATILENSTGGTYAESLTSIKEQAPMFFRNKKAAINVTTAKEILESFSFVKRANVTVQGKEVVYQIIPTSGLMEPTSAEQSQLTSEFHPCLMLGYSGRYSPNNYKNLVTSADISATGIAIEALILSGYDPTFIQNSIKQIIMDITNPLIKAEYGGSFLKSDVDILIRSSVAGVQSVTFKIKIGSTYQIMPDITLNKDEIFRTIKESEIIVTTNVV